MAKKDPSNPKSETELQRRIASGSQDPDDYHDLADLLVDSGRYEEAISLYQQALLLPLTGLQKARISVEYGWLLYETGQKEEALKLAESAIAYIKNEPGTVEVLACRGASQGLLAHCLWFTDPDAGTEAARSALKWLERVVVEAPNFEDIAATYYDAGRLQNLLGNTKEAMILCEKCLQYELKHRERLACLTVYAEALRCEGRFVEAEQTLQEVLQFVQDDKGTLANLYFSKGLIQRATKRLAEAEASFQKALLAMQADPYLRNDPDFISEINWNVAAVCYDLGDYKEAAAAYREVFRYHPYDDPYQRDVLLWLGHCYLAMGSHAEARECYEKLLASPNASDEQKAGAREGLAKLFYESGQYREAAEAFEDTLRYYAPDDGRRPNALLWLGNCHEATGAYTKARDCFEQVITLPRASENDKAWARQGAVRSLAKLSYESGQYEEAAAAFEDVLAYQPEDNPNHWNTLVWLGNCREVGGGHSEAKVYFEKVLASPHALEADKDLARRGLVRNMGKFYYESRKYHEAAAAFEEALVYYPEDDPDRTYILLWLGYCYEGSAVYTKARDCFEQVVASPHASEADKESAQQGLTRLPPSSKRSYH